MSDADDTGPGTLQERLDRARALMTRRSLEAQSSTADWSSRAPLRPLHGMDRHPAVLKLQEQRSFFGRAGITDPYFRPHDSVSADTIQIGGRELLNFSGYNYLGLSGHPEVSAAAKAAIDRYGTSASASRLASGELLLHCQLEHGLADALGAEACLVFVSGYGTNVVTIGHLCGPNDLIIHDVLAHSSILIGCQLSGARHLSFPHNDVAALDRLLSENRRYHERVLIVVEGVYSMDGDVAPLDQLIEIKRRHHALLMIDEAHSLGVLGVRGLGIGEHYPIDRSAVDIWMGTLSKTLAACGGYVAGSPELVDCLRYSAPGFIYSVGLPPADTAAALAALQVMRREPVRVQRLRKLAALFVEQARARGLDTGASAGSAVVPIVLGDSVRTMLVAQRLFEEGICVYPIIYPAVEEGKGRLRFFLTTLHDEEQLRQAVDAVARAAMEIGSSFGARVR